MKIIFYGALAFYLIFFNVQSSKVTKLNSASLFLHDNTASPTSYTMPHGGLNEQETGNVFFVSCTIS